MLYTFNSSPLFLTSKLLCVLTIILSNYQWCQMPLRDEREDVGLRTRLIDSSVLFTTDLGADFVAPLR